MNPFEFFSHLRASILGFLTSLPYYNGTRGLNGLIGFILSKSESFRKLVPKLAFGTSGLEKSEKN